MHKLIELVLTGDAAKVEDYLRDPMSDEDATAILNEMLLYNLDQHHNIKELLLNYLFLRHNAISRLLLEEQFSVLREIINSNQKDIKIDQSITTADLGKIFQLVKNGLFAKKAMMHAIEVENESMIRGIFSMMRSYGGLQPDYDLQLKAQMHGYTNIFQGPRFERKWFFANDEGKELKVRKEDWVAANEIFDALMKENGGKEFSIKISRKDPKYAKYKLQRSFVMTYKKSEDGNFEKGVYALARGSADLHNSDIHEGILGHGSSAMVKLAVSEAGKTMVFRAGKLSKSSNQRELSERTGTIHIDSNQKSTLWIHDRSIQQKDRELQTLQEGVTLNKHLSQQSDNISGDDCINIIRLLQSELQSFHASGWVHHDISGNNIMVKIDQDRRINEVKLIDFDEAGKISEGHSSKDDLPFFILLVHTLIQRSTLKDNKELMDWLNPLVIKCYPYIGQSTIGIGNKIEGLPNSLEAFISELNNRAAPHTKFHA